MAEASEATMYSPLPIPTIKGLEERAATNFRGSFLEMTASP